LRLLTLPIIHWMLQGLVLSVFSFLEVKYDTLNLLQNETNVKRLNAYMDHILHALLRVDSPIVEKVTGELSMQKLRAIYFLGKNSNSFQRELAD
jgi:hypothetical protein